MPRRPAQFHCKLSPAESMSLGERHRLQQKGRHFASVGDDWLISSELGHSVQPLTCASNGNVGDDSELIHAADERLNGDAP